MTKICRKCWRIRDRSSFTGNPRLRDGLQSYCKTCMVEAVKASLAKHPTTVARQKARAAERAAEAAEVRRRAGLRGQTCLTRLRQCRGCGSTFWRPEGMRTKLYCSKACSPDKSRHIKDGQRRRAIGSRHRVNVALRDQLADRDGWACGICGEFIDFSIKAPDRMSPTLDHIIPVIKGGTHDLKNLRLAHLRCNSRKGSRVA